MTSILTDSAKHIVEKVIDTIVDESRNLFCFKCIVDDFEKEKAELKAKWKTISGDIEDTRRRANYIREDVIHWEKEAKNLIDEDTKKNLSCFLGWCPDCISRYKRGRQLIQMINDVRRLKIINFDSVGRPPHLPGVETHSSQSFIHFESRDLQYKQLLDAIADENNYIVGVQGMGGAGKTTLAIEVGRKLKESGMFDCVPFAAVSNNPDIKKIQDSIAGPLGLSLKDMNEWERRNMIWKRLTDGQNIMIILDDVWEPINFEEIGIPSGDRNCRVLLTSRNVRVCHSMGCSRPIQLGLLSDEDAWILFKKHAGIDDNFQKGFHDRGQEITEECKNLPVAIAAVASTLKDRPLEEWDAAKTAMRNPLPMLDVDENLRKIYQLLRYSYDNMKSDKAKRLFLLFSVLPEDFEISIENLTSLGIGAGLFEEVGRYCEARSQLLALRTKLIHSCLCLETENGCVKLHDLVREVALWIANGDIQSIKLYEEKRKTLPLEEEKVKYLLCDLLQVRDMDVFPRWFDASHLEILFIAMEEVSDVVKVSYTFFEKMTRLRVLVLEHHNLSKLALTLPVSFQSLSNIRYISLSDWKLGDISIMRTLLSLVTLELSGCSISELPNEITKLEKLKLLRLDECEIERNNPFEVIGRCSGLEELYFQSNELAILDTLNEIEAILPNTTFPMLNRYQLEDDTVRDSSMPKTVCLQNVDALVSEAAFKYLVNGAEIIRLRGIEKEWRNLIPEIVPMKHNSINDLTELSLTSCSKVQCLVNTEQSHSHVPNVFYKLVELNLVSMDKLEELCIGPLPSEFLKSLQRLIINQCENLQGMLFKTKLNLCNLKIMKLRNCPMLASLFQPSTARSLVELEDLLLYRCEQLTHIVTEQGSKDQAEEERLNEDNDQKDHCIMFPKLKFLEIDICNQLECIFPILFPGDIPQLENIKISGCDEMKNIIGCNQEEEDSLKEMHPSVKRSISRNDCKTKQPNSKNKKMFPCSCLCWYPKKYGSKLRTASSIKSMHPQIHSPFSSASNLLNIRIMTLWDCPKVISLFTISIASTMLLEILRVEKCDGLKHVITDTRDDEECKRCNSIFPKLKQISIKKCNKLKYVIGPNHLEDHNHKLDINILMDFPALEILILRFLPNLINICPKNYFVTWPYLKELELDEDCSHVNPYSNSLYSRLINKDSREIEKYFLTLESLYIKDSKVERVFHLDGFQITEQPLNMALKYLKLENLSQMIYIYVAPRSYFTFQHLQALLIVKCVKLELIFPTCVLRCLPELKRLAIIECKELKEIIEDDMENHKLCQQPYFPKLETAIVQQCHKLKYLIASNDLPNLQFLFIDGASELEELIRFEQVQGDDKIPMVEVKFPKLKFVVFMNLSNLCFGAESLQTTSYRVVHNCPKLSFTSTTSMVELRELVKGSLHGELLRDLEIEVMLNQFTAEATTDYQVESEIQRVSGSKLPSLQTNEELKEKFVEKVSSSETPATTISLTDSKSELIDMQSPSPFQIMLNKTHSNELADGQVMTEPFLMNQLKPLTKIEGNIEISQSNEATGFNLIGREGELSVVSVDNIIATQRNEQPKKEFIGRASISDMPTIASSPTDSDMIKGSSPSLLNIPLPKMHPNSIKRGIEEGATSENANIETFSTHFKLASSQPGPLVNRQHKPYTSSEISLSQMDTCTNEENEGHHINTQDFRDDDLINLFQLEEEHSDRQIGTASVSVVSADHPVTNDNLVVKVLADMEESLKMPLKDIASSEANTLQLLTALNFLSWHSAEYVTLSEGLKAVVHSLHNEFPNILCSFKQAFATTNKFSMLEEKEKSIKQELANRKEVASDLVSKISKVKYFMDEAQQKEAMMKEQMSRLEKEMKDCEANLSSLQEQKNKFVAETMGYKEEFETVRNDKSQMLEDQRKAWQKLSEINYKWSLFCSQFENSRITANSPS